MFYEGDLSEWDMIMSFDLLDIAQAGVPPHRRTLLVGADQLCRLTRSMDPQASSWEPAERHVSAQAVSSVSTRPPKTDIEDEYGLSEGAFYMALGELEQSIPQVDIFGSAALRKLSRLQTMEDNGWK